MDSKATTKNSSAKEGERQEERIDVRQELRRFEAMLEELKVTFEQHFMGILPLPPDKDHEDVKKLLRKLRRAPFRNSQMKYQLRSLESRYNIYNTYWQRVLREREAGTYVKDVFKAELRARLAEEEARAQTALGAADRQMRELFESYRLALERQTGRRPDLDYKSFRTSLVKRAKELKGKTGGKRLSFAVAVKDGKVVLQAKAKDPAK